MKIVSGASTDTGQVRDVNEDSYLVDRRLELFAIADGMGGHRAGEIASDTALTGLREAIDEGVEVADAIGRANAAVWDKAAGDTELAGMGTTLTAALFTDGTLTIGHVGDSRAYLLREGRLERLTVDHSLVEELVREGRITEDQAAVHPQRSIITRALGVDSTVDVDLYSLVLAAGDRIMLCSDGLTSMVRTDAITQLLADEPDPTAAANALVDAANAAGGEDNVTVLVLDAIGEGRDPLPSSVAAAIRGETRTAGPDGSTEVVTATPVTATTTTPSIDAAASPDAESPSAAPPRDTAAYREPRIERRPARTVGRVLLFALPILVIFAVAIGSIWWYATHSYFVTFEDGQVSVYRGRPGGLLLWDPELVQRTDIERASLSDDAEQVIADRKEFGSRSAALAFVKRVKETATTTTSSTTSTTTAPAVPAPAPTDTATPTP